MRIALPSGGWSKRQRSSEREPTLIDAKRPALRSEPIENKAIAASREGRAFKGRTLHAQSPLHRSGSWHGRIGSPSF